MSALAAGPRHAGPAPAAPVATRATPRRRRERTRPPRLPGDRVVLTAWTALLVNVLAQSGDVQLLPIPPKVGQVVTQGALGVALLAALAVNRRLVVRASWFLGLLSLLAVVALMTSVHNQFPLGSGFRAVRLTTFVAVLWLLTPWWSRRDLLLLRCHRLALGGVLVVVLAGAAISPGLAFSFEGRLSGVLWPIPPTQVAHYAAVVVGSTALLWLTRTLSTGWSASLLAVSTAMLLATHTRTALAATLVGLAVAACSLFLGHRRVRRTAAVVVGLGVVGLPLVAPALLTWLQRGQTTQEATQLTGRTKVWDEVLAAPRPWLSDLVGSGLSNRSFNGLPIDSNWFATWLDQGWLGIVVEVAMLVGLLAWATTRARGVHRAVALFLVCYCAVASITETGLGDASPYLLDLTVAAALLHAAGPRPRPLVGDAA